MPNHLGSKVGFQGNFDEDAMVVKLLKNAGAVPIMRGNTPEKSIGWETYNHVTGRTKNPYNFSKTCGGSSGGDATLIASNACTFGVGSDFAGSIRLPAVCQN